MSTVELRFKWPAGQCVFMLSQAQAIKAAVALRKLGLGLTFKGVEAMVTTKTTKFSEAENIIARVVRR